MRLVLNDEANSVYTMLHAPGGYAPDVMDDLKGRAADMYRETLISRHLIARRADVEGDEEAEADVE